MLALPMRGFDGQENRRERKEEEEWLSESAECAAAGRRRRGSDWSDTANPPDVRF